MIYTPNTGYVMTQGPGGPVVVPMQAGGGMVAVHTVPPGAQGPQPQMVILPAGAEGYQPQLAQVSPAGAMAAGYQPQGAEMPPSYTQGQYMTQQNEQV